MSIRYAKENDRKNRERRERERKVKERYREGGRDKRVRGERRAE